ncbi:ATP-grasp domain-containing protein [Kitasatospora sp. MMS16-BH015]|uniref:ATP-grasp domain-containing protein n=1 Tax=Kitasatospora sp. MMS16-BH015 TaxID=2018025 RepID=UPI000CA0AB2E|nr:NikS protein [Kitasatospora sp. MMS16-BH015]AUG75059.1 ATP-grasp domain-containing protein [Kitasatospora sp. MMS16-BH015]
MTVLVLHHRGSLVSTPYGDWLADYDGDLLLITSREHLALAGEELPAPGGVFARAFAVEGYETSGRVEALALDLAREYDIRYVVACQRQDLERAAQLRDILGLPGQRMDTVRPFRDKVATKQRAEAAGLAVAAYRDLECAAELIGFAEEHGFPVVLGPRDGTGSAGPEILYSAGQLDEYLAERFDLPGPYLPDLMVEAFVPGSLCHVDGLVVDGRVVAAWPSEQQYAPASFATDTGPRLDLTLDLDDPLAHRLLKFAEHALDALGGPEHHAFHAEVFHTPDDELVLHGIACRTGGVTIRDTVRTVFGIDPSEASIRAQLGLPLPAWLTEQHVMPRRMSGRLALMKRPGRVVAVPEGAPPFPWVTRYQVFVTPGSTMAAAAHSSDFLLTALVAGADQAECRARLALVAEWFLAGLVLA